MGSPIVTGGYGFSPLFVVTGGYNSAAIVVPVNVFALDSLQVISPTCIRVRFTGIPKTGSGTSANRGDVAANYSLAGPYNISILIASVNSSDSEVIDLYLDQPIDVGSWVLTVASTIQTYLGGSLIAPYTLAFAIAKAEQPAINNGAENDLCGDITKYLNPAFRDKTNWGAMIRALSAGDCIVRDNAVKAFNQYYISTAEGEYLEQRAADQGISKPFNTGISDAQFRALALAIKNDKVTEVAFNKVLKVFYGDDSTNAYVESRLYEPFVLADGNTLELLIDGLHEVIVDINRSEYQTLRRAKAVEVAAAINRAFEKFNIEGYAIEHLNPVTNKTVIRVYTKTMGLSGSVMVVGGLAQHSFEFETKIFEAQNPLPTLPQWAISGTTNGIATLTCSLDTIYDLRQVRVGDYVLINGVEFAEGNRGSFAINDVSYTYSGSTLTQYIKVENKFVSSQTVTQLDFASVTFFRPKKKTIYDSTQYVATSQMGGQSYVSIPTTTKIVNRTNGTAAYGQLNQSFAISNLTRDNNGLVTVTTATSHDIAVGSQIEIDSFRSNNSLPAITPGTSSGAFSSGTANGTSDKSQLTHWSIDNTVQGIWATYFKDSLNNCWVLGGNKTNGTIGKFTNEYFRVNTVTTSADGQKQYAYTWKQGVGTTNVGIAVCQLTSSAYLNKLYCVGGYTTGPWQNYEAFNFVFSPHTYDTTFTTNFTTPLAIKNADGAISAFSGTNSLIYSGGWANQKPTQASNQITIIDQTTLATSSTGTMKYARAMHKMSPLSDDGITGTALAIGGRQPADNSIRSTLGYSNWSFEDAFGAPTFSGPVSVFASGNDRPMGKIGHGVKLSLPMDSVGGAGQAAINAQLIGSYTISGWFSKGTGTIIRNGLSIAPVVAGDNTLIAFGIDPSDSKFFIKWMTGANVVKLKKTAISYTTLFTETVVLGKPKYHHFAITNSINSGNSTFALYIDGVFLEQWTDTAPTDGGNGSWVFGRTDTVAVGFTECIDEVGITSTVLTAAQIWEQFIAEVGVAYDAPEDLTQMPVGKVLNSCEIVSTSGTSVITSSMAFARFAFGLIKLPDNRIVAIGGIGYNPSKDSIPYNKSQRQLELRSVEIFDPKTQEWLSLPNMNYSHSYPAVHYYDGKIYVAGSLNNATTEYLDLNTMKWHIVESMPSIKGFGGGFGVNEVMVLPGGAYTGTATIIQSVGDNQLLINGSINKHGINDIHKVLSIGASSLTFRTRDTGWISGTTGNITALTSKTNDIQGPYTLSQDGIKPTAIKGTLATAIPKFGTTNSLTLGTNEALLFPQTAGGFVVVSFGYSRQTTFIKYLGRISNNVIRIDLSFVFQHDQPVGAKVFWMATKDKAAFDQIAAFYLTDSSLGKTAVKDTLEEISASGIKLNIDVRYPDDRGLGNSGYPESGNYKISDIVEIYGD